MEITNEIDSMISEKELAEINSKLDTEKEFIVTFVEDGILQYEIFQYLKSGGKFTNFVKAYRWLTSQVKHLYSLSEETAPITALDVSLHYYEKKDGVVLLKYFADETYPLVTVQTKSPVKFLLHGVEQPGLHFQSVEETFELAVLKTANLFSELIECKITK